MVLARTSYIVCDDMVFNYNAESAERLASYPAQAAVTMKMWEQPGYEARSQNLE